ncbi:MAG: MerR family transcriptional regulator [Desulfosalsimonas sp.]
MSSGGHIPDKLYFRIKEATEITGLAAYVLRFWESEFSAINPKRTESGQRLYRRSDIEAILTIKHLLYDKKFTIEGAKKHLKNRQKQSGSVPSDKIIREIRAELEAIRAILDQWPS